MSCPAGAASPTCHPSGSATLPALSPLVRALSFLPSPFPRNRGGPGGEGEAPLASLLCLCHPVPALLLKRRAPPHPTPSPPSGLSALTGSARVRPDGGQGHEKARGCQSWERGPGKMASEGPKSRAARTEWGQAVAAWPGKLNSRSFSSGDEEGPSPATGSPPCVRGRELSGLERQQTRV